MLGLLILGLGFPIESRRRSWQKPMSGTSRRRSIGTMRKCLRCAASCFPAERQARRHFTWPVPFVVEPNEASSPSAQRACLVLCSSTSIDCRTCCSRWRGWSTIVPKCRSGSGERPHAWDGSLISILAFTASKTFRASSCDTRSLIAPHSTRTVSSSTSIATSHRSRSIPSGVSETIGCRGGSASALFEPDRRLDTQTDMGAPLIRTRADRMRSFGIVRSCQ